MFTAGDQLTDTKHVRTPQGCGKSPLHSRSSVDDGSRWTQAAASAVAIVFNRNGLVRSATDVPLMGSEIARLGIEAMAQNLGMVSF